MAKGRTPFNLFIDGIGDDVIIVKSEGSRVATSYNVEEAVFYS